MRKIFIATVLLLVFGGSLPLCAQESSQGPLQQVSDHCYVVHIEEDGENIAVVTTGQGALVFDPPPEPDLSLFIEALKDLKVGPVRWMVRTGFSYVRPEGVDYFARQGAVLLVGFRQDSSSALSAEASSPPGALPEPDIGPDVSEDSGSVLIPPPDRTESMARYPDVPQGETFPFPRLIFKEEMYLYPDDLEIRIQELQHAARTRADVFAYVPDEKVLFAGRLFDPLYYPDIDVAAGGSALQWIDGLEQVIDSVPLLISAIPPKESEEEKEAAGDEAAAAPETVPEDGAPDSEGEAEEKTLEEMIAVVTSRGEVSDLQAMKDMLETAKKLRSGISRAVRSGQSCERYLDSPNAAPYRIYGNFFPYATQLCDELVEKK